LDPFDGFGNTEIDPGVVTGRYETIGNVFYTGPGGVHLLLVRPTWINIAMVDPQVACTNGRCVPPDREARKR